MLGVEVVDDQEIEIGDGRHLAGAELAHGHDRQATTGNAAMLGFEIAGDLAQECANDSARKIGEVLTRTSRLLGPCQ